MSNELDSRHLVSGWSLVGVRLLVTYRPYLCVVPVNNRVYSCKCWPSGIRRVKMFQIRTVGVCSPCADKDSLQFGSLLQISLQRRSHGQTIPAQIEVVLGHGVFHELIDLGEGVLGYNVDRLESVWEGSGRLRSGGRIVGSIWRRLRRRPVQMKGR